MPELVLRNRQRTRRIRLPLLRRIARVLLTERLHLEDFALGVHLVAAPEMTRLNRKFLGHETSTDVITFDYLEDEVQASNLFSGVRPSSAAATSARSAGSVCPNAAGSPGASAPEDGRAPPNKFQASPLPRPVAAQNPGTRNHCPVLHGEIFICLDDAVSQARQFRTTWQIELVRYLVHGILHLLGYDDAASSARRVMKRAENRWLRSLSREFSFRQLARTGAAANRNATNVSLFQRRHTKVRP